jgi:hypothetical protein
MRLLTAARCWPIILSGGAPMVRINKRQRRKLQQRAREYAADAERLALSAPDRAAAYASIAESSAIRASPQKSRRLRQLKTQKFDAQHGICPACGDPLPKWFTVLYRKNTARNYTAANTELLHSDCSLARTAKAKRGSSAQEPGSVISQTTPPPCFSFGGRAGRPCSRASRAAACN